MNIVRNRIIRSLQITQEKYINNIINRFCFDDLLPQNTPMVTRQAANKEREDKTEINEFLGWVSFLPAIFPWTHFSPSILSPQNFFLYILFPLAHFSPLKKEYFELEYSFVFWFMSN